ncbi:MAG: hypothetical protein GTO18_04535, partial [Anaerolineales bacterium]|nr:hypothetical protein [Anaerolineales bacterium]
MRFRTLVPYVVFLAILVMAVKPSADTDTWWHLRSGETILVRQEILRRDPFSLTQFGEPWIYPGWLAQISLFTIFDEFSFGGLNIFTGVMVLVAFLLIWPVLEG